MALSNGFFQIHFLQDLIPNHRLYHKNKRKYLEQTCRSQKDTFLRIK